MPSSRIGYENPDLTAFIQRVPFNLDFEVHSNLVATLKNEQARLSSMSSKIKFSIITPTWNTPPQFLQELLLSCFAQSWTNWELILCDDGSTKREHIAIIKKYTELDDRIRLVESPKNGGISAARNLGIESATGDYIGFLDHDDLLHPQCLGIFARYILEGKDKWTFLFSNEVKLFEDSSEVVDFLNKPGWDLATLERSNYIAHFVAIKKELLANLKQKDGVIFRSEFDTAEDFDLFLRLGKMPAFQCKHIPLFCYLWRKSGNSTADDLEAKPHVFERTEEVLKKHFYPIEVKLIRPNQLERKNRFFGIRYEGPMPGVVRVMVPFKDRSDLTLKCLDHLEKQTVSCEVYLINNASADLATEKNIKNWIDASQRKQTYHWIDYPGVFNYAKMHNDVIRQHARSGDFILFLNNDVEIKSPDAIETFAKELHLHPQTATVGLRLHFPVDNSIQHAGIKFGNKTKGSGYRIVAHIFGEPPAQEFIFDEHIVAGVTFACAMTRYDTLAKLGWLDEMFVPIGYGDVDFCLNAIKHGYSHFYFGTLYGIHHESKTRKSFDEGFEQMVLYERHSDVIQKAVANQLGYDLHVFGLQSFVRPLRYRIADFFNDKFKTIFYPAHFLVKKILKIFV